MQRANILIFTCLLLILSNKLFHKNERFSFFLIFGLVWTHFQTYSRQKVQNEHLFEKMGLVAEVPVSYFDFVHDTVQCYSYFRCVNPLDQIEWPKEEYSSLHYHHTDNNCSIRSLTSQYRYFQSIIMLTARLIYKPQGESFEPDYIDEPTGHYPTFSLSNVMKGIKISSSDGSEFGPRVRSILQAMEQVYGSAYDPSIDTLSRQPSSLKYDYKLKWDVK